MKIYGHEDILNKIQNYLSSPIRGGICIMGPKGIGKFKIAKLIAGNLLDIYSEDEEELTKSLFQHPDFFYLSNDDQTIKVDSIRELQTRVNLMPSTVKQKVFLIDNANTATIQAQNSLLKILEEKQSTNIFILVAHDNLLNTVESRTINLKLNAIPNSIMKDYLLEQKENLDDIELYLCLCEGSIGNYHLYKESPSMFEDFRKILKFFNDIDDKKNIIKLFHAFKEKDKEFFYDLYSNQLMSLFSLLENIFYGAYLKSLSISSDGIIEFSNMNSLYTTIDIFLILDTIKNHRLMYKQRKYSKNDFFNLLRTLA